MFPSKRAKTSDEGFSYTYFNDQNLGHQTLGGQLMSAADLMMTCLGLKPLLVWQGYKGITAPALPCNILFISFCMGSRSHQWATLVQHLEKQETEAIFIWGYLCCFLLSKKALDHGSDMVSLHSPGWPGTHKDLLAFAAQVMALKTYTTAYPVIVPFFHLWINLYLFLLAALPLQVSTVESLTLLYRTQLEWGRAMKEETCLFTQPRDTQLGRPDFSPSSFIFPTR